MKSGMSTAATAAVPKSAASEKEVDGARKLWGGRFTGKTDPLMERFNNSIDFDKRLWRADIDGSIAYARALNRCGLLTKQEADSLAGGLEKVASEWQDGTFKIVSGDEDIHTANERRLGEIVGSVAGKLHTGRSRNDQVATDVRLWLRSEIDCLDGALCALISCAADRAEADVDHLMPGYTHLQPAQPIRFSHWLLSHAWSWVRDADRLRDARKRLNFMPLGSGAIAGHAFQLDRIALAKSLGFSGGPTQNSMDSVSDRDFIVETLSTASLLGVHLSRWAEDVIIYSSSEFKFLTLSDAYSTGSSLMPQKKNPDAMELLRGKSGRLIGSLTTLLVVLKGTPSTYNKDLQEDKEPLFDAVDTLHGLLPIAHGVLSTLTLHPEKMRSRLVAEMLATDLADYLVRKGVPFRQTHHIAGAAVRLSEESGRPLSSLTLAELKTLHPLFEEDVAAVWSYENSVEKKASMGGTGRAPVLEQVKLIRKWLEEKKKAGAL